MTSYRKSGSYLFKGIERNIDTPLAEAVRRAGGQSAFARIVARKQSTIFDWLKQNRALPAELVLAAERETGLSRHVLRPDIFGNAAVTPVAIGVPSDRVLFSQGAAS